MIRNKVFFLLLAFVGQALFTVIDVFEATNGHEPRVAISCGYTPFHIDLQTGKWTSDTDNVAVCDTNKVDVKKYCQKVYKNLNISNIVEANKPAKIPNWCKPGKKQCNEAKQVVPYRCLVEDYEADALMVPRHCKFNHLHDQELCLTHDDWRKRAGKHCRSQDMKLNEYGILLSCGTDMFTGVEFVCCPKKHHKNKNHKKNKLGKGGKVDRKRFELELVSFQNYLPSETKGCDRSTHEGKRQKMEETHRTRIAAVVDEWDEAERRYKKLKEKDPVSAAQKMNRTLQVFRETLSALEEEAKQERARLRDEHAQCITASINKQKRDAMLQYIIAIEERPHSVQKILQTVRQFIQTCEHDRLHSLRHFEHVRRRAPEKAKTQRGSLLMHLRELNTVVNASINILKFLPDVARQFGLTAKSDDAVLKPMTRAPVVTHKEHEHKELPLALKELLEKSKKMEKAKEMAKPKEIEKPNNSIESKKEKPEPINDTKEKLKKGTLRPTDEAPSHEIGKQIIVNVKAITKEATKKDTESYESRKAEKTESNRAHGEDFHVKEMKNAKAMIEKATKKSYKSHKAEITEDKGVRDENFNKDKPNHRQAFFKRPRSPAAFAAVIGLGVGALVIMLGIIAALVVRRNRTHTPRVVLAEVDSDDREHLVKMQKNGYENPTYKFFYY